MAVKLFMWRARHGDPGHISMDVDGTYMSYWPATQSSAKKAFKLGFTQAAHLSQEHRFDRKVERKPHDDQKTLHGLNEKAMKDAWALVVLNPGRYHMVKHNCATLIAAVLEAGSGVKPAFTPRINIGERVSWTPSRVLLRILYLGNTIQMWTPEQIWTYAESIRQELEKR